MSKWVKRLLGIAAIATTVAGLFYFLKKEDTASEEDFEDDFEDEDFDLDTDLKPASERGYVSLKPQSNSEETEADNEKSETVSEEA